MCVTDRCYTTPCRESKGLGLVVKGNRKIGSTNLHTLMGGQLISTTRIANNAFKTRKPYLRMSFISLCPSKSKLVDSSSDSDADETKRYLFYVGGPWSLVNSGCSQHGHVEFIRYDRSNYMLTLQCKHPIPAGSEILARYADVPIWDGVVMRCGLRGCNKVTSFYSLSDRLV